MRASDGIDINFPIDILPPFPVRLLKLVDSIESRNEERKIPLVHAGLTSISHESFPPSTHFSRGQINDIH